MKQKVAIDKIILDFDSTILNGELLEIIAEIAFEDDPEKDRKIDEIAQITALGMEGKISFRESLSCRLSLLDLNPEILKRTIEKSKSLINDDYLKNISFFADKDVYIVSGGYKNIIDELSEHIMVPRSKIFANNFLSDGVRISGVDMSNPLTESDGKAKVAKSISGGVRTIMIGDGMTDYFVKKSGGADYFGAYVGIIDRPAVSAKADFVLKSFSDLREIFNKT